MACRWVRDKTIGLWFLPECIGGMNVGDVSACYCERPNRVELLEARIEKLERRLALTKEIS